MNLLAFTGKMGAGKSTAIELLRGFSIGKVELVKFAQPLYDMQQYIYERIDSVYKRPTTFVKDRKLLQYLGTEWGRDTISLNLWVDVWKVEVKARRGEADTVVCDDCRFENEAQAVKELGGTIIEIISSKTDSRIDTKAGISNHSSEAGLPRQYVDFIITNDGTLDDLKEKIRQVLQRL